MSHEQYLKLMYLLFFVLTDSIVGCSASYSSSCLV